MDTREELIGRVIDDKYRIDSVIGSGGMGAVFRGTHLQLQRPVAIKILREELVANAVANARFEREARSAARIEHPYATRVYDYGTLDDGVAYIVMEFVDGSSLREILSRHKRLPAPNAVDIAIKTAEALAAAHAHRVVHRDVKPENIMVTATVDGRALVKVVDFGIAKLVAEDEATQLTRPAELVGTPRYMAPELFSDDAVDERIDVYSLGVVLYEMLAGRPPFEGSFGEVIGKHMFAEPPTFESLGVDVPEAVEQVVRIALAKEPDERPGTALDLAERLAGALPGADETPLAFLPYRATGPVGPKTKSIESETADDKDRYATSYLDSIAPTSPSERRAASRNEIVIALPDALVRTATLAKGVVAGGGRSRSYALGASAVALAVALVMGPTFASRDETAIAASPASAVVSVPVDASAGPTSEDDQTLEPLEAVADEIAAANAAAHARPESDAKRDETRAADREPRRQARTAPRQRVDPLRAVGRVVRIDKHLRKLF
jgi:serine/threonine-protein kinase